MAIYLITAGVLLVYLVFVWFLATWMKLQGWQLWFLRGALAFLGFCAAAVVVWFYTKKKNAETAQAEYGLETTIAELDLLAREAARRLRSSTLGRGAKLQSLPLVFLVGQAASTKTSTIIHSGLDPELLSGQVYREREVLPTRLANFWFTREAIFVDPAGALIGQAPLWKRLVRLARPSRLSRGLSKGQQAPRAAIVCFECPNFLQSSASEKTLSAARQIALRLHDISQQLGASFPVYVVFTKLDLVSFFPDFARNLNDEEASSVLGATLPVHSAPAGVYADEATKRLTRAFDEMFYSLADKRTELLGREFEVDKLGGIYEFPRELRKLRKLLVQFMVEVARPSHLSVNPFLRGFYFSGVRPIFVSDITPGEAVVRGPEIEPDGGATKIFSPQADFGSVSGRAPAPARSRGAAKVPQWVFLTQLFNDIILKDRVAFATSSFSTAVNLYRRMGLILVTALALTFISGFTVSYFSNKHLSSQVEKAAHAFYSVPSATEFPSLSSLQELDASGQVLDQLEEYSKSGAPLSLRWGLYSGTELYPPACEAYARGLNQVILTSVRSSLVADLKALRVPSATGQQGDVSAQYGSVYRELKTYLVITNEAGHASDDPSLPADILATYQQNRAGAPEQRELVRQQLNRYSVALARSPSCFRAQVDDEAVRSARDYLNNFPPEQRIYQAMVAYAAAGQKDVDYNEQYPNPIISDAYRVQAGFQKNSWPRMMDALSHSERYSGGETWVLGEGARSSADPRAFVPTLRERYRNDFVGAWENFLKSARFSGYRKSDDMTKKLGEIAGARSPLLLVPCLLSIHLPADEVVRKTFRPATGIVPENCESAVTGPANAEYTEKLFALSDCLDKMDREPTPEQRDADKTLCSDKAAEVKSVAGRMVARNEGDRDSVNSAVRTLLESPVPYIPVPTPKIPGESLCKALVALGSRFPDGDALQNLLSIFVPGGELDQNGPDKNGPPAVQLNAQYLRFYATAKNVQKALYPDGKSLQLHYSITAAPSAGIGGFKLSVGSQSLTAFGTPKELTWTGDPQEEVQLTANGISSPTQQGPLAIFKFVSEFGEDGRLAGHNYEFAIRVTQSVGKEAGPPLKLRLSINAGDATILFSKGSVKGLGCTTGVGGH